MKHAYLFFLSLIFIGVLNAQCYSETQLTFGTTPLTSPTTLTLLDDHNSGKIAIGFPFCFYGASYDTLLICENGAVSFDLSMANSYCPWPIASSIPTSTMVPKNSILFPMMDLYSSGGGTMSYEMTGVSPNRKFIVDFDSIPVYGCTTLVYIGQVILFETSNNIQINLTQKPLCNSWNGGYAIEGIQNATGTFAVAVSGRNYPMQWSATNDSRLFIPTCNVCNGPGIATVQNPEINIFVSEANQITIVPNGNEYKVVSIYNTLGQEIKFTQAGNSISLTENKRGMYIVNLELNRNRVSKKVMLN